MKRVVQAHPEIFVLKKKNYSSLEKNVIFYNYLYYNFYYSEKVTFISYFFVTKTSRQKRARKYAAAAATSGGKKRVGERASATNGAKNNQTPGLFVLLQLGFKFCFKVKIVLSRLNGVFPGSFLSEMAEQVCKKVLNWFSENVSVVLSDGEKKELLEALEKNQLDEEMLDCADEGDLQSVVPQNWGLKPRFFLMKAFKHLKGQFVYACF